MNKKRSILWICTFLILAVTGVTFVAGLVIKVDPFFHYHKPYTDQYFYRLDNQRSQNDGVLKHFDYTGMITGTSMTENFKTTEAEALWGGTFVKTCFSGASYKEVNDAIATALKHNPNLKTVIRGLDGSHSLEDKDAMRLDLGDYPLYLYDENPFNDTNYVFNRDVLFSRVYKMAVENPLKKVSPGITSFNQYSNWMRRFTFGRGSVLTEEITAPKERPQQELTENEKEVILENYQLNITGIADEYPDVTFYYFLPPYSLLWWKDNVGYGKALKYVQAEQLLIEEVLKHPNMKLFSFHSRTDITSDLNYYRDTMHYAGWVNSLMLKCMYDGRYQLTKDNYEDYLAKELETYLTFDYASMNGQVDYECDEYAAVLLCHEYKDIAPLALDEQVLANAALCAAELTETEHGAGLRCLNGQAADPAALEQAKELGYIGCQVEIEDITPYEYLLFYGQKVNGDGQPTVTISNDRGKQVLDFTRKASDVDMEIHPYVMNVSDLTGKVTIVFSGADAENAKDAEYIFSGIALY